MHPVLFHIGSFALPTYGVLLATALIAAVITVTRLGRREGLDTSRLLDFSTWIIVVALVGAKVLMILTDWDFYWRNPGQIFTWATLGAAGVFYGGFLAATLFAIWYIRLFKLPLWKVFDVYAPAIALGQSIGRLGCFAAGCDYGRPTNSFLGVVFSNANLGGAPLGVHLHPTQVYESLATLTIFSILVWRYPHKSRDGEIFLLYLTLYAVARFFLEFLRGDEDRGFVFNHLFSTSQFIAILALVTAGLLALSFWGRRPAAMSHAAAALPDAKGR
ncbi:MAG TPA: prolipoprotein diacylglyceryl transferase [Terriglobia bacterium]|nr:prolipoprotein diacylglyceryl transferase [Terriglobia bacterium]